MEENIKGAFIMTLFSLCYSLCFLIQKVILVKYPQVGVNEQHIYRYGIYGIISIIGVYLKNYKLLFDKETSKVLALRLLFSVLWGITFPFSINALRVSTSSTLYILSCVLTSLVISYFIEEKITRIDIFINSSFFFASCLIAKPFLGQGEDTPIGLLLGVILLIFQIICIYYHKMIQGKVSNDALNVYLSILFLIYGYFCIKITGETFHLDLPIVIHNTFLGLFFSGGIGFFYVAIESGQLNYVLPFENSTLIFSLILGKAFLEESVDFFDMIGTFLIVLLVIAKSMILIVENEEEKVIVENSKVFVELGENNISFNISKIHDEKFFEVNNFNNNDNDLIK